MAVGEQTRGKTTNWDAPWPYGYPGSVESAGSVAAPLLAGFSFALIGLIVPEGTGIRWPGLALTLFVAAGLLFVAAVQCGFWARLWTVTPSDLCEWSPDDPDDRKRAEQRLHAKGFRLWSNRLTWAYRWGILALLAGVTILLVPPGNLSGMRWAAIVLAAMGWLLEGCGSLLVGSSKRVRFRSTTISLTLPKTAPRHFGFAVQSHSDGSPVGSDQSSGPLRPKKI